MKRWLTFGLQIAVGAGMIPWSTGVALIEAMGCDSGRVPPRELERWENEGGRVGGPTA